MFSGFLRSEGGSSVTKVGRANEILETQRWNDKYWLWKQKLKFTLVEEVLEGFWRCMHFLQNVTKGFQIFTSTTKWLQLEMCSSFKNFRCILHETSAFSMQYKKTNTYCEILLFKKNQLNIHFVSSTKFSVQFKKLSMQFFIIAFNQTLRCGHIWFISQIFIKTLYQHICEACGQPLPDRKTP